MKSDIGVRKAAIRNRLNIIIHGLVALLESGEEYHVLIPKPDEMNHVGKFGNPYQGGFDGLHCFRECQYSIEGVAKRTSPSPEPSGTDGVVLLGKYLELKDSHVATTIVVPKPDAVRGYRAVETYGTDVALDDSPILLRNPEQVYEVMVFSYFDFENPAAPRIILNGADGPFEVPSYTGDFGGTFWNLCIYSESLDSASTDDHSPLFNRMFAVKQKDGKLGPLRLRLSIPGDSTILADGPLPFTATRIGIRNLELQRLVELNSVLTGDPTSCSPIWIKNNP